MICRLTVFRWTTSAALCRKTIFDIIARFKNPDAEKTAPARKNPSSCPRQEIAENGYDLSINKYKKTEYKPVEYPPTESEIMGQLRRLEKEVNTAMDELDKMLK